MRNTTRRSTNKNKNKRRTCKKQCSFRRRPKNKKISTTRRGGSQPYLRVRKPDPYLQQQLSSNGFNKLGHEERHEIRKFLNKHENRALNVTSLNTNQDSRPIRLSDKTAMKYVLNRQNLERAEIENQYDIRNPSEQVILKFSRYNFDNNINLKDMSMVKRILFFYCNFKSTLQEDEIIKGVQHIYLDECTLPNVYFLSDIKETIGIRKCILISNNFQHIADVLHKVKYIFFTDVTIKNEEGDILGVIEHNELTFGIPTDAIDF